MAAGVDRTDAEPASRSAQIRLDTALAVAALANRAYSIALVVYVFNATHSSTWVAAAAAARYLPGIATGAFARPLLERFSARAVLVTADLCCAVALAGMAAAVQADASPAVAIALAAVVRIAAGGQPIAAARLLPIVAGGRDLAHVAARQAATDKLMLLAGPAIGGLMLLVVSPAGALAILAVVTLVAAAISSALPAPPVRAEATKPWHELATTDRSLALATAGIGIFVALAALSGFIYGTDTVLLAVVSSNWLHLGNAGYGVLFAGLGAGGLLAAPAVNALVRRQHLASWLLLGMCVYTLPSVAVAHTHSAAAVLVLQALRGAGSLTVDVVALTELQRIVLPRGLPTLTARLTTVVFTAVAVGALSTPVLLNAIDIAGALTVLGVVPPLVMLGLYPRLREYDVRMSQRLEELGPRIAVLEPLGLLHATSRPVLERLAADVTEVRAAPGSTIITADDPADAFYVVLSGHLDVFVGDRQVNELHDGDWFGEIGLLEGRRRTATVRAHDRCELYRIGGAAFLDAFTQLPPSPSLLDSVAARIATGQLTGDGSHDASPA